MVMDRAPFRLQVMLVCSLVLHAGLLQFFMSKKIGESQKRLELTEVEFQVEEAKPTEMEKLMSKLIVAPKTPVAAPEKDLARSAIAELEKTSFTKVVGMKNKLRLDDFSEKDLSNLAALPKLEAMAKPLPAPLSLAKATTATISLQGSKRNFALKALEAKVVPMEELPAADFGPGISQRAFQQPEAIVQKVKAERRAQLGKAPLDRIVLKRETFITGEVKNRELLHRETPLVPRWLEEKGIAAEVVIRFVVNPDGEVGDKLFVQKTSGYSELDRLALSALKKFVFAPLPLNVRQLEQTGVITIRFAAGNN